MCFHATVTEVSVQGRLEGRCVWEGVLFNAKTRRAQRKVARSFTLLYRGLAVRWALDRIGHWKLQHVLPSTTRRYSRVQLCATNRARRLCTAIHPNLPEPRRFSQRDGAPTCSRLWACGGAKPTASRRSVLVAASPRCGLPGWRGGAGPGFLKPPARGASVPLLRIVRGGFVGT